MFAMVCMFMFLVTPAVNAQEKMSKSEKAAAYDKAKSDAKKSAAEVEKAKKANDKMAKELAELKAENEALKNQPAPELQTQPEEQQTSRDQNKPTVELNFTMADLMRNPDSIARVMTAAIKAQKKVQQAQQEYADLIAGKVPAKPAGPVVPKKGYLVDNDKKTYTYYMSYKDSVPELPDGYTANVLPR